MSAPDIEATMMLLRRMANGTFIAHAREDVPALVAEVRSLRASLDFEQREGARHKADADALMARNAELRAQVADLHEVRERANEMSLRYEAERDSAWARAEALTRVVRDYRRSVCHGECARYEECDEAGEGGCLEHRPDECPACDCGLAALDVALAALKPSAAKETT